MTYKHPVLTLFAKWWFRAVKGRVAMAGPIHSTSRMFLCPTEAAADALGDNDVAAICLPGNGAHNEEVGHLIQDRDVVIAGSYSDDQFRANATQLAQAHANAYIAVDVPQGWGEDFDAAVARLPREQILQWIDAVPGPNSDVTGRPLRITGARSAGLLSPRLVEIQADSSAELWHAIRFAIARWCSGAPIGAPAERPTRLELFDVHGTGAYALRSIDTLAEAAGLDAYALTDSFSIHRPEAMGPLVQEVHRGGERLYEEGDQADELRKRCRQVNLIAFPGDALAHGDRFARLRVESLLALRRIAEETEATVFVFGCARGMPAADLFDERIRVSRTRWGLTLTHDSGSSMPSLPDLHLKWGHHGLLEPIGRYGSAFEARKYSLAFDALEVLGIIDTAARESIRVPTSFLRHAGASEILCSFEEMPDSLASTQNDLYIRRLLRFLERRGLITDVPLSDNKRSPRTWILTSQGRRVLNASTAHPDHVDVFAFGAEQVDLYGEETAWSAPDIGAANDDIPDDDGCDAEFGDTVPF